VQQQRAFLLSKAASDGFLMSERMACAKKFTSKEWDNETRLDYFLARYYSSTQLERFFVFIILEKSRAINVQFNKRFPKSYTKGKTGCCSAFVNY
jgi:hypothetical protein